MTRRTTRIAIGMAAAAVLFCLSGAASAQPVTVTNPGNTTPGLSATYASLAAAIVLVHPEMEFTAG